MKFTDVKEIFSNMDQNFDPNAAQGVNAVIQYHITGDGGGNWYVTIRDGTCQVQEGTHESPNVTLTLSDETWLGMVNKEISGTQAFMSGKLKISGDISLSIRLEKMFP